MIIPVNGVKSSWLYVSVSIKQENYFLLNNLFHLITACKYICTHQHNVWPDHQKMCSAVGLGSFCGESEERILCMILYLVNVLLDNAFKMMNSPSSILGLS